MENPILVTGAAGRVGAVGRTVTELLLKRRRIEPSRPDRYPNRHAEVHRLAGWGYNRYWMAEHHSMRHLRHIDERLHAVMLRHRPLRTSNGSRCDRDT